MERKLFVNYDELAPTYDHRYQENGPSGTANALLNLCMQIQSERVLEAACGTGHWLQVISSAFPQINVLGLDRSSGMLAQARQHDSQLSLVQARAEQFPLPGQSFDLVFCVNALHHFEDQQQFIREAHRVLRPGGRLAVISSNPRHAQESWYIYHYFPESYAIDMQRFTPWETIMDWMREAGFSAPAAEQIEVIQRSMVGDQVWEDPFLQKHSCSQLALLSQQEYQAGLDRIRADLEKASPDKRNCLFRADIYMGMISAIA